MALNSGSALKTLEEEFTRIKDAVNFKEKEVESLDEELKLLKS